MSDDRWTVRRESGPLGTDTRVSGVGDCYDLVLRLALDGGLSVTEAADVCQVTLLRLADHQVDMSRPTQPTAEWLIRTALEQCVVVRRLRLWRHSRRANAGADAVSA